MARARGCDLRAVIAGAIICWAVADGVASGQEGAEVTEDLGNAYVLARRTTSQGSIIETLLFAGQAIVTEVAVPAGSDGSVAAGTTGAAAVARAPAGTANAARGDAANLPLGMGPGFGGTLLTGEIVDDYLVLHRTRASGPVTHEIFHDGHKVGIVSEVDSSVRAGRSSGRNSFAFESTDDRFVVHLTQPDGTRIHATTEHGRFSSQVVERAAIPALPRAAVVMPPSQPLLEPVKPLIGRSPEPQRLAIPQEPAGRIMVEEPTRQIVPALAEPVPLPRACPQPRLRPAIAVAPVQTAIPSPPPGNRTSTPAPTTTAPAARPADASVSAPPPAAAAAARPVASAPTTAAPAARPKPAATSVSAPPPAAARPVASVTTAAPAARPKPAAASVSAFAPAGARPVASAPTTAAPARPKPAAASAEPRASATAASASKPKSTTTANARASPAVAAKPVAKPSRSPPSGQ
jgi:hypothetical protein